jgi:hypothetical protein
MERRQLRRGNLSGGIVALLLLLTSTAACGGSGAPTPTLVPLERVRPTPTLAATATAASAEPAATLTPSPALTATPVATAEPSTPTSPSEPATWYDGGVLALFSNGDGEQADLYAMEADGKTRLLLADVGRDARVSPDGRWLGFVRWGQDGRGSLELHDARSGERRRITPETTSGLLRFAFDPDGRRLAYLDLGAFTQAGVPWSLVVVDLESGAAAQYEALMRSQGARPLPGAPVGWSQAVPDKDELLIDTFMPYTEGGWMGMWGVTLPADGQSAQLDALPLRELIPAVPTYSSQVFLAPDGRSVAFLGRDPDYYPDNYFPEFYDLAVNRLEIAALADGARTVLVEASDGSALARGLSWSPAGERLLFAQGAYEGESFAELSLKSSDRSGAVVTYGPLTLPLLGGLLELAWCDPSLALYVTWDGGSGTQHLLSFDLNTGVSGEISHGGQLQIVGCAP